MIPLPFYLQHDKSFNRIHDWNLFDWVECFHGLKKIKNIPLNGVIIAKS